MIERIDDDDRLRNLPIQVVISNCFLQVLVFSSWDQRSGCRRRGNRAQAGDDLNLDRHVISSQLNVFWQCLPRRQLPAIRQCWQFNQLIGLAA